MAEPGIRGAQLPPSKGPPVYDVVDVTGGEVLDVTCLGDEILGVSGHWLPPTVSPPNGRSRPCTEWEGVCPWHEHRQVWMGFIAVYNHRANRRDVLRLGPVGAQALLKHSVQHFGLRGARVLLRKGGAGRTATIVAVKSDSPPIVPLPPAHAIDATICLVLGCLRLPDPLAPGGHFNPPSESDEKGGV